MVGGGRGGVGALHGMAPSFLHQKYTFLSAEWLPDKITTDDPEPQNKSIITTFALLQTPSPLLVSLDANTEQTDYQAFSPVVRFGTPHPLTRRRVCTRTPPPPSPFGSGGGGEGTLACGRGGRGPNSKEGTDTVVLQVSWYVCTLWDAIFQLSYESCEEEKKETE